MNHINTPLPAHLKASIDRYVNEGVPTGGFLQACIENDLSGAITRADDNNLSAIPAIVRYLYNECPSLCWGSKGIMAKWIEGFQYGKMGRTHE